MYTTLKCLGQMAREACHDPLDHCLECLRMSYPACHKSRLWVFSACIKSFSSTSKRNLTVCVHESLHFKAWRYKRRGGLGVISMSHKLRKSEFPSQLCCSTLSKKYAKHKRLTRA